MTAVRLLSLAAALAWVAPAVAADPPAAPKRYAVAVGVNAYEHPRLPALSYAVNDATELAAVLRPAGYDVALLTDKTDTKPTKGNIEAAVRSALTRCRAGDTVVLAFAGHGVQFDGAADAYFCPSDARPSDNGKDSLVSLTKLYADLDDSFAGVKVLLVDACRDDPSLGRSSRGVTADAAPRPPRGVAALFSCSAGERAFEHDSLKHGVFFHHVLEGLKGKAKNDRGQVTFNSLSDYVSYHVSDQTPRLVGGGAKQSPNQKADVSGASPVLVTNRPAAEVAAASLKQGLDLYFGRGVAVDKAAATPHFQAAAEAGNAEGMLHFAYAYRFGNGLAADDAKATEWLHKAADAGNAAAMFSMGSALANGRGVPRDEAKAVEWYQKAADAGEPGAMTNLGLMYASGRGVKQDDARAVEWYKKALAAGETQAMYNLGYMHASGRGVKQDDARAVEWYKKAIAAGETQALVALGVMHSQGRGGLAKDAAEAARWYEKAANAGEAVAMYYLGSMHEDGRGVEKDLKKAREWYQKAAKLGDEDAVKRLKFLDESN